MKVALDALLDGTSGGSLFPKEARPGSPTQIFSDDGSGAPGMVAPLPDLSAEVEGEKADPVAAQELIEAEKEERED